MRIEAFRAWLSLRAYGAVTSALFGASTAPLAMRRRFERFGATSRERLLRRHPGLLFGDHAVGRLGMESVCAVQAPERTILYLHGGAFVMGSPTSYRSRVARVSYRCAAEVFVPDYRLAPEHPYPAALDDALAAWRHLRSLRRGPLLVAGDSAGGGLALSLMLRLRDLGEPAPDGAVLLSPWVDLTAPGEAETGDLWFTPDHLRVWARHYAGPADAADPLISPGLGVLSGLPPFLLLVGEDELLAEQGRRAVLRGKEAGIDARLLVGRRMQHDWPLTLPWLAESRRAWREIAAFVERTSATAGDGVPVCSARSGSARDLGVAPELAQEGAGNDTLVGGM
jgi:epsilon-lactone hydrolase